MGDPVKAGFGQPQRSSVDLTITEVMYAQQSIGQFNIDWRGRQASFCAGWCEINGWMHRECSVPCAARPLAMTAVVCVGDQISTRDYSVGVQMLHSVGEGNEIAYKAAFTVWKLDGGRVPYGIFQVSLRSNACVPVCLSKCRLAARSYGRLTPCDLK